ncbi:MAG: NAD(P)-dependent oxidoreductase [Thermoleophilia bacterium]|nr:NAD(P)-dependent oxidoreductase [Thermoleophilia bacterium]
MPRLAVLVTGGSGFLGGHLVRALVERGDAVHLLLRAGSVLAPQLEERLTVTRIPEPTDSDAAADAVQLALETSAPDLVISLATLRDVSDLRAAARMFDANVRLPALLAAGLAARGGGGMITTASYMLAPGGTAPSLYSASRASIDPVLDWACAHHDITTATLALTSLYGPGDTRAKVLAALLRAADSGAPMPLVHPDRRLDMLHVSDAVRAYLHAADLLAAGELAPRARHEVTSAAPTTLGELVAAVEAATGRPIDARWGERATTPSDAVDPPRTPNWLPGWKPAVTLDAGLATIVRPAVSVPGTPR